MSSEPLPSHDWFDPASDRIGHSAMAGRASAHRAVAIRVRTGLLALHRAR
jgi:hypothetical protein